MTRLLTVILLTGIFLFASPACAEIQTYEGVGEHIVMKGETQNFAKKQAKLLAERDILEQIYFYISSQSETRNSNLTKDEVITIAAGQMNIIKTKFSTTTNEGNFVVKAIVIAEIDPDEIPRAVEREKKNRL